MGLRLFYGLVRNTLGMSLLPRYGGRLPQLDEPPQMHALPYMHELLYMLASDPVRVYAALA